MKIYLSVWWLFLWALSLSSQPYTRQDTLRGTITPQRAWWDLTHYDLHIEFDIQNKFIRGSNRISFVTIVPSQTMQIDLQEPLKITNVEFQGKSASYHREGNVYWIQLPHPLPHGQSEKMTVFYEGHPVEAVRPPWDGGVTWTKDETGAPFVATSCQGLGASVWWPCKDHMYDEPDSMDIRITVPPGLTDISNGRLSTIDYLPDGRRTYHWQVTNPINNYGVNANIGQYISWHDTLHGEKGILDLDFFVLPHHYDIAQTQFEDVYRTLRAFEYWFGPYPFYEDGFKLVEVPYLGMEHQSSVTYGNGFKMGYKGTDLSGTGWGLKWDFIIVHETAHEWWANSVTYKDMADMWIHESFANYAESLFIEYHYGTEGANAYVIGTRKNIENQRPIISDYNVNSHGPIDMYYKGGNMLHTLRQWLDDDRQWRKILRGLQEEFYHQTVTTAQVEKYMEENTGLELAPFFNQYLRDTRIPVLEYRTKGKTLYYRYSNVVDDFALPLKVSFNGPGWNWIRPTGEWQKLKMTTGLRSLLVDPNFYIEVRQAP